MAYGVVHFFPGGTRDQYEKSLAAVHPGKGELPAGQIIHLGGPTEGGWLVIAVFDEQQQWEAFRSGTLMPALEKGVAGGFTSPPREQAFAVDYKKVV